MSDKVVLFYFPYHFSCVLSVLENTRDYLRGCLLSITPPVQKGKDMSDK